MYLNYKYSIKCFIMARADIFVALVAQWLQSGGCGFEPRQGRDVVFRGKGTLHELSSLHPDGNGYLAIDSERYCQCVSV